MRRYERGLYRDLAYMMRYGKQPIESVTRLTRTRVGKIIKALSWIVSEENGKGS